MATIPMYASQTGSSWKAAKILGTSSESYPPPPPPQPTSHTDSMEAALDGPPSPSRLRQLSKQMRRDSAVDKHQSQHTTSSGSSSLLSTSERPSWEHGMDQLTLSRKSSQRSSSGSMPSRTERPDSLQIFGKTLFNRRGKMRRESTDQGSVHSNEKDEPAPPAPKERESVLNAMMARRKGSRDTRMDESSLRKVQISGPYNFQHLTHAPRNDMPDFEQSNRSDLVANFSEIRWGRRPTDPSPLKGMEDRFHFTNFSSEALSSTPEDASVEQYGDSVDPLARPNPVRERSYSSWQKRVVSPPAPLRPLGQRTHSEEQMRGPPPPRPPRSPLGSSFSNNTVPPPRLSSRGSLPMQPILTKQPVQPAQPAQPAEPTEPEQADGGELARTRTNSSIRQPAPFVFSPPPRMPDPPATAMGLISESGSEDVPDDGFSHAVTTPDDAAWPLTSNALSALPDVPEEEESWVMARHHAFSRSRGDSLRGSISVPMLRRTSAAQAPMPNRRPPSNASDTLGKFNLFAAQRVLQEDDSGACQDDFLRDDWEDDIDYCYEHAAEADCDYAWERPSCDMIREDEHEDEHEDEEAVSPRQQVASPRHTSTGPAPRVLFPHNGYDVPALSPASQTSLVTPHEALTPTVQQGPVTSNFSLPRRDSSTINLHRGHLRGASRGSTFKESQGFNLSPSLVIPNDFHQQMLMHERAELREEDEDEEFMTHNSPYLECPTSFSNSASKARSSSSTFHSTYSEQSTSSSRHKSSQSTSTAFTRWTASSTSTSLEGWQAPSEDNEKTAAQGDEDVVNALPVFDDAAAKRDLSRERHMRAQSHADIFSAKAGFEPAPQETKTAVKEQPVRTRHRARTTSRSHNPPQLGLFPSTTSSHPMMGGRI